MKTRITINDIRDANRTVIAFGYCRLQALLNYISPNYYMANGAGRRADFYELPNGWLLSTGYGPYERIAPRDKQKAEQIKKALIEAEAQVQRDNLRADARAMILNDIFHRLDG